MVERLGHIPRPGEQLKAGEATITVVRGDARAVREILITPAQPLDIEQARAAMSRERRSPWKVDGPRVFAMTERTFAPATGPGRSRQAGQPLRSIACAICPSRISASPKSTSIAALRRGVPEVIFGEGKSAAQIAAIGTRVAATGGQPGGHAAGPKKARELRRRKLRALDYHPEARLGVIIKRGPRPAATAL